MHVVSTTVTPNDGDEFSKVVRRKPKLWDNYPVNDYFRDNKPARLRLNLGPFVGRSTDLCDHLAGYLSNPMNEWEASKLPLLTLADYLRDPKLYSSEESFQNSVSELYSHEEAYEQLRAIIFASRASALD
jgi:hyaluronoglucosaminidase